MRRVPETVTTRARAFRNNATPEERKVWALLSRYRPKFTRQLPIGPYIADLACREARLIVEIDGGQHAESQRDAARDHWLAQQGWITFRLWNSDVRANPTGAAEAILAKAAECLGGTHPQPLPSREGRTRRPKSKNPLPEREAQGWVASETSHVPSSKCSRKTTIPGTRISFKTPRQS